MLLLNSNLINKLKELQKGWGVMDKQILKESGIYYEELMERVMGKKELLERFLNKFVDMKLIDELSNLKTSESNYEYFLYVHNLKDVSGTLGMHELYKTSAELEEKIRSNETDTQDLLEKLRENLDKLYNGIIKARDYQGA